MLSIRIKLEFSNTQLMDPFLLVICVLFLSLLGTSLGVITGLTPGIHVNLVAASFLALQPQLVMLVSLLCGWTQPTYEDILLLISCIIVANAVSHTFLDYIPSVFLGAPDTDTALSVLPGHRMLLQGKGYEAVLLSAFGSLVALFFFLCLMFPARLIMGNPFHAYQKLSWSIPFILVTVVSLLIVSEQTRLERGRPVLYCSANGILQDERHYRRMQKLLGNEVEGPLSNFLWKAVVAEGTIWNINSRFAVLQTRKRRIKVKFESPLDLEEGKRVYIAGILEPSPSVGRALRTKIWALGVFLVSGLLGYVVLSTSLFAANWYPFPSLIPDKNSVGLFPLFTGLFGLSTLLLSLARSTGIPDQDVEINEGDLYRGRFSPAMKGAVAGCFAGWFPGVSNATATVIAKMLDDRERKDESEKEFIVAVSAVNTSSCFFTLLALFVLLRARSGVMNAIMTELGETLVTWEEIHFLPLGMAILLLSGVLAACTGFFLTKKLGRKFAQACSNIDYRRLVLFIMVLLLAMVFFLSGLLGIIVAFLATSLGLIPPLVGVKRVHLMGCLILPLIILFAG
ncbi:MAG: tripartite tricarboxylate transporter permease [Thermoplasmata archaeon]